MTIIDMFKGWLARPGTEANEDHPNSEIEFPIDDLSRPTPPLTRAPSPLLYGSGQFSPWGEGPLPTIPRGYREAVIAYGDPSDSAGKLNKTWEREHMVVARDLPGQWNGNKANKGKLYMHKLFEPYLYQFLSRCRAAGIIDEIDTIGCFNFRRIRHSTDPKAPLSYHSFGVAIDINAKDNVAWYRDMRSARNDTKRRGPIPRPFSEGWFDYWPHGVSPRLVAAAESVGMRWGGRWGSFCDPMHFELVA